MVRFGGRLPDMTIEEKIGIAQDLFRTWGDEIGKDAKVGGLLEALREKILASRKVSRELGVWGVCQHCEEAEGGSCCGAGIENRYSPYLLLITLLLGGSLPAGRQLATSCYFLGRAGCGLVARHILCLNYLCPRLQRWLAHSDLITLQAVTGEEMDTVFLLHEAVKHFIRSHSHDHRPSA